MIFIIYSNLNRKTIIDVKNDISVNFISYNLNNKTIIDVQNCISVKDKDQRTFLYCCSCFNELCCFAMGRIVFPEYSITPTSHQERENFLFNEALNTFYLRLYGIRNMVKDHSDSEKGNLLPPHRLLLSINSKGSFICTIPQTG